MGTRRPAFLPNGGCARLGALLAATFCCGRVFAQACPQNFDDLVAPTLPPGWSSSFVGEGAVWVTSSLSADSPPYAVGIASSPMNTGDSRLDSPLAGQRERLVFRHAYDLEQFNDSDAFDGGVLEISIDGAAFQDILAAGGEFVSGGYDHVILDYAENPLAGRAVWSGSSGGYVTTEVKLPAAALASPSALRWRLGSDLTIGDGSWYVDSVRCAPEGAAWRYAANHPQAVIDQASTALDGVLYSFGGYSGNTVSDQAYKFDGVAWSAIAALPVPLQHAVAVNDGSEIYILGGAGRNNSFSNQLYKYTPATDSYTTLASFAQGIWAHSAALVDGKIVKFGGQFSGAGVGVRLTEIYDLASDTWYGAADYPQSVSFVAAFAYGGYVYGAGGAMDQFTSSLKTYRYDLAANLWEDAPIADLPQKRWGAASARLGAGALLAGGYVAASSGIGSISGSVVFWDGPSDTWRELPALLAKRARMSGATLDSGFVVVGGRSVGEFFGSADVQVFDRLFADGFD
jgi:hypothetical protein